MTGTWKGLYKGAFKGLYRDFTGTYRVSRFLRAPSTNELVWLPPVLAGADRADGGILGVVEARLDALDDEAVKGFQADDCLVRAANTKSAWHKAKVQTLATRMLGPWPVIYGANGRQTIAKNGHPLGESHPWRRSPYFDGKSLQIEKVRCDFSKNADHVV